MQARHLKDRLRAILLATPFVGAVACGGSGPVPCGLPGGECRRCGYEAQVYPLESPSLYDATGCVAACEDLLRSPPVDCELLTLPDGLPAVSCTTTSLCGGRLPPGLLGSSAGWGTAVGAHFGAASYLEAAAVEAFEILAGELEAHRAPTPLLLAARRSVREEIGHARTAGALAHRFGSAPVQPHFGERPAPRTLLEIALDNAREGCASETYGTLLAMWQARYARDPVVRGAMRTIAREELGHAQHAFEIADWLGPRLTRPQRAVVQDAQQATLHSLQATADVEVPSELVALAGLPPQAVAGELLHNLRSVLRA